MCLWLDGHNEWGQHFAHWEGGMRGVERGCCLQQYVQPHVNTVGPGPLLRGDITKARQMGPRMRNMETYKHYSGSMILFG